VRSPEPAVAMRSGMRDTYAVPWLRCLASEPSGTGRRSGILGRSGSQLGFRLSLPDVAMSPPRGSNAVPCNATVIEPSAASFAKTSLRAFPAWRRVGGALRRLMRRPAATRSRDGLSKLISK
jgi:hypothetical protein